ncbi:serine hydrolase domain-containing protein [Actinomycetes bacterium KLBMP 9759]
MDARFTKAGLSRMRSVLSGYVERGEHSGLATFVSRGDEVHVDVYGSLGFDSSQAVRPDTIFRIASMSKPVIAAGAMLLVEDCVLRLDDPIDALLPELADRTVLRSVDAQVDDTVAAVRPISVRDLLTFRCGIGMVFAPEGRYPIQDAHDEALGMPGPPRPQDMPAPDEWMRRVGSLPLVFQPGERWLYNTAADVLSVLVERASGQRLDAFLRERLFEPLGMRDTGFSVPEAAIDRLGTHYANDWRTGERVVFDEGRGGQWSRPPAFFSGAGGLVSTVVDYAAFATMLLRDGRHGGEQLLSRASVRLMTADHLTAEQKAPPVLGPAMFGVTGWGFGGRVITDREGVGLSPGSYGWDGGLGSSAYADRAEDVVTVLMTQQAWTAPQPPAIHHDFWTTSYAALA